MPRELPEIKKKVLCSNLEIAFAKIRKIKQNANLGSETYENADDVLLILFQIKAQALAMEKRLYLYKETIEGLGFKRVRKR